MWTSQVDLQERGLGLGIERPRRAVAAERQLCPYGRRAVRGGQPAPAQRVRGGRERMLIQGIRPSGGHGVMRPLLLQHRGGAGRQRRRSAQGQLRAECIEDCLHGEMYFGFIRIEGPLRLLAQMALCNLIGAVHRPRVEPLHSLRVKHGHARRPVLGGDFSYSRQVASRPALPRQQPKRADPRPQRMHHAIPAVDALEAMRRQGLVNPVLDFTGQH